jgi:hypothetical protein
MLLQFEAETLVPELGPILSLTDAMRAADALHVMGPHTVVRLCSSCHAELPSWLPAVCLYRLSFMARGNASPPPQAKPSRSSHPAQFHQVITSMSLASHPGQVLLLASTRKSQAAGPIAQRLMLRIPRIDSYFTGTGEQWGVELLENRCVFRTCVVSGLSV